MCNRTNFTVFRSNGPPSFQSRCRCFFVTPQISGSGSITVYGVSDRFVTRLVLRFMGGGNHPPNIHCPPRCPLARTFRRPTAGRCSLATILRSRCKTRNGEIRNGCSCIQCTLFRLSDSKKCKESLKNEGYLPQFRHHHHRDRNQ